jgi:hypothetical protein
MKTEVVPRGDNLRQIGYTEKVEQKRTVSMTYTGHIEAGKVVLDEPARIPEGARVRIEVLSLPAAAVDSDLAPSLAEQLAGVIGKAEQLPADWSENHDRYLREEHVG